LAHGDKLKYDINIPTVVIYRRILSLENVGTAAVNYQGIFKTLAPGACVIKLITMVIYLDSMVKP
jgi:hypothetical protein